MRERKRPASDGNRSQVVKDIDSFSQIIYTLNCNIDCLIKATRSLPTDEEIRSGEYDQSTWEIINDLVFYCEEIGNIGQELKGCIKNDIV